MSEFKCVCGCMYFNSCMFERSSVCMRLHFMCVCVCMLMRVIVYELNMHVCVIVLICDLTRSWFGFLDFSNWMLAAMTKLVCNSNRIKPVSTQRPYCKIVPSISGNRNLEINLTTHRHRNLKLFRQLAETVIWNQT